MQQVMSRTQRRRQQTYFPPAAVCCVLLTLLAAMMFTGYWPMRSNPYNSYVRQACAWLDGRLDLENGPLLTWLELAIYEGKYFVSFPPFPSYVMLPFAAIFGLDVPDGWIALVVTCIGVWYACLIYLRCCRDQHGLFWVLFLFLGTGYLFISLNGWVWFIAQNMCFTLSLMAIYHALRGQGCISLSCWACAVGCRPMVMLYLPCLLYLLYMHQRKQFPQDAPWRIVLRRWYWILLPALIGGSYMLLNYLRFGSVLEFGHNYLPEFTRAEHGQFSHHYILSNARDLLRLPRWVNQMQPLSFFTANGIAFWLTNPLLVVMAAAWVYALFIHKSRSVFHLVFMPVLTLAYVVIICAHRTLGGWHFGNRYLLDIMPWLFICFLYWKPKKDCFALWSRPVFLFGAAVTLLGTVATYNNWI